MTSALSTKKAETHRAAVIVDYWHLRGFDVTTSIELIGNPDAHAPVYAIVSDMLNGWPRAKALSALTHPAIRG